MKDSRPEATDVGQIRADNDAILHAEHMSKKPIFATTGSEAEKIDVRLSYGIVRLFSEGLYASPNKAIEELVANSFDAGALRVAVFLSSDFHEQGATIAVLDDGEGMDAGGLKQHWLIGKSLKRKLAKLPRDRQQIGQFGIGKLATYVLANRLTHITKKAGKYYSTSMDFSTVDKLGDEEVEPKKPVQISLRKLTEQQAKTALATWTVSPAFRKSGAKLFGPSSAKSWTFAILSDLKVKVHQISRPKLAWVLSTALPLRDDFAIHLDGTKLESSKVGKGLQKKWVLGKDIEKLPKPGPKNIEATEDKSQTKDLSKRFALRHEPLGRITGYVEAYKDLLSGKSDEIGRSYGFFVYVLGRLINVEDGHFGISPNELRHGTFGRIRVVVNIDGLDKFLQSDRERVRDGPELIDAQNILRGIFNFVRPYVEKAIADEDPGAKLARTLASSPSSVSRRPIIEMARAVLAGSAKSKYVAVPPSTTPAERDSFIAALETRLETPETFVAGVEFLFDAGSDLGIAVYDTKTGFLRINGFHPFVGAFYDQFSSAGSGLPLDLFAMAEVLLEAQLHQSGYSQQHVDTVMAARDQYLRDVAQSSGRRTAFVVSKALQDARNDEDKLEEEVVAAFTSLGFDAARDGRKGKADGIARADLSADAKGNPRHYSVTLEAKSKKKDGTTVSAATIDVAVIAKHRDEYQSAHAIVVGPSFATTHGDKATIAKLIDKDRELTKGNGDAKTITLITVDDLARLVRIAPIKGVGLSKLRGLFESCRLPEECKAWVDAIEASKPKKQPYKDVIDAIFQLQKKYKRAAVAYDALRVALGARTPAIDYDTNEGLIDLCKAMMEMAKGYITATNSTVELDQSPANVLAAIESATKPAIDDK
jgi:hypothetical protein